MLVNIAKAYQMMQLGESEADEHNEVIGVLLRIGVARIFDCGGPNHKSHAMTSSEIFKKGTFCGAKISQNGRSEVVVCCHLTRILVKEDGKN